MKAVNIFIVVVAVGEGIKKKSQDWPQLANYRHWIMGTWGFNIFFCIELEMFGIFHNC